MDVARQTHELRSCTICNTEFKFYEAARGATGQYCSLQCKGIGMKKKRIQKICELCKNEFQPSISYEKKKFCSTECYGQSMIGIEKPSFWKISSKEEKINKLKLSFEKYVIRNENGCWEWKGTPSKPYGSLQYGENSKAISAHRASWMIHKGEIPIDMFICHKCDNPRCTNPEHLFLGTALANVRDMFEKERHPIHKGQDSSGAKLNDVQVFEIKTLLKANKKITEIANIFGVHIVTIHDIKYKKTWSHIEV